MIKIKELELENFKSFEKAKIPFDEGFNIITGLNGAGKSNIISAIRFVLALDTFEDDTKYITKGKNFTKVSVILTNDDFEKSSISKEITKVTITSNNGCIKYFVNEQEVGLSAYRNKIALFSAIGTRLIDKMEFLHMNDEMEKEISKASNNCQYIIVSLKDITSADETIYVTHDENGCSHIDIKKMDYYTKFFKEWRFLMDISVTKALDMIKQKPETEIKDFIDLSYIEIENIIKKFDIKLDEPLSCEIKDGKRIEEREVEVFDFIKKGYNIQELSNTLMFSKSVARTYVKKVLAKILLHLYPNLKELASTRYNT